MREFLQKWYQDKGPRWCAKQLGKSYDSIKEMAHREGLNFAGSKRDRIRKHLEDRLLEDGWRKTAFDLGLSEGTVRRWAKKFSVKEPLDARGAKPMELSEDQQRLILASYPERSTNIIAGESGLSNDVVIGFLKRRCLYIGYGRRADQAVNKEFFRWSADFAYVFGYMCADGSIGEYPVTDYDGRNVRRMTHSSITSKDDHILWDIRSRMGLKARPYSFVRDTGERYWCLATSCRWVFDQWMSFGLRPRKSFVGMSIPEMPDEFVCHFIRGFFDGDGTKDSNEYRVGFGCTDREFVEWIRCRIVRVIGGQEPMISVADNATPYHYFGVYADRAKRLLDWMRPREGDLRLHRKWAA